jgi:tetratricopeptide (TPR) repeat protein
VSQGQGESVERDFQDAMESKSRGDYERAIAQFKRILEKEPKHARAHLNLGLVYGFVGMFDDSLAELERAAQYDPESIEAHLCIGKTFCMLGMYEDAKRSFEVVLQLQPGHWEAKKQLTYLNQMAAGGNR